LDRNPNLVCGISRDIALPQEEPHDDIDISNPSWGRFRSGESGDGVENETRKSDGMVARAGDVDIA
jgi:hypothetical protein